MKAIYNAANPIDAQLVSDLLADSGIQTHVQGSFLVGGIGELPAGEMMRIWVADAWVPGWVFRRKRSEILAQFLSREHVFNTDLFRSELEAQARHNLQRSISVLRPWWRRF